MLEFINDYDRGCIKTGRDHHIVHQSALNRQTALTRFGHDDTKRRRDPIDAVILS